MAFGLSPYALGTYGAAIVEPVIDVPGCVTLTLTAPEVGVTFASGSLVIGFGAAGVSVSISAPEATVVMTAPSVDVDFEECD